MEFTQIGFERYGAPSSADVDAESFALVCEAAATGGVRATQVRMGDLAIFPAFVDALALAPSLAEALKRAFRQAGGVSALLSGERKPPASGLASRLKGASLAEARGIVEDIFTLSGTQMQGARTLDEIAEGLMAQAVDAGMEDEQTPALARQTLEAVMAVDCAPHNAADALLAIARQAGLNGVDDALERLSRRVARMTELAPEGLEFARFGTPFGRRFNYYDGFVFELFAPGADPRRPFGAGGRYDGLIRDLSSGSVDMTAIGGVVRPDRLASALEACS